LGTRQYNWALGSQYQPTHQNIGHWDVRSPILTNFVGHWDPNVNQHTTHWSLGHSITHIHKCRCPLGSQCNQHTNALVIVTCDHQYSKIRIGLLALGPMMVIHCHHCKPVTTGPSPGGSQPRVSAIQITPVPLKLRWMPTKYIFDCELETSKSVSLVQ
jgi:hypothetical protein